MNQVDKEFDEPQGDDSANKPMIADIIDRYGVGATEREQAKVPIAPPLPSYSLELGKEASMRSDPYPYVPPTAEYFNDDPETEIRYQANFLFWHYVAEVHVQVGEEYNMKLANRNAADIRGYLERGELIEYRAPIDAPRVVFRSPDTQVWDGEREEWVTQPHWNEAYKQWGRREKRRDPQTGFESDVWVFWSDEAKTQWAGETNFVDHNDYLGGK